MKSVSAMKTTSKSWFENFQRQLPLRKIYVKYFEKKEYIVNGFTSFLQYQFAIKSNAINKHSIHM